MKIKIVYGIDMRLWRYNLTADKPTPSAYNDLLAYVCETFQFTDHSQFRLSYIDDDDTQTTVCSDEDFNDAYTSAFAQEKKSLKLYIKDSAPRPQGEQNAQNVEEKAQEPPIESTIPHKKEKKEATSSDSSPPSEQEVNAFFSNALIMDLLSDLLVATFEALDVSKFEISLMDCIQGVLLSSGHKYDQLTSNSVWPYFMNTLLPRYSLQISQFVVPMMRGGAINAQSMKLWIPTIVNMMKYQSQGAAQGNGWFKGGCGGKRRRGRRGRRGGGWRNNHRGWRGFHGGHRGFHGVHGHGPNGVFGGQPQDHWSGCPYPYHQNHPQHVPSTPPVHVQQDEDQIEQEAFEYTEELVAIMNMGFTNMAKIKKLLREHKGNKQLAVQELVNNANKQ